MKLITTFFILFVFLYQISFAENPAIIILDSGRNVSLRGLSVVNDKVVWCSGSNGTVAKSVDGGKSFVWMNITGYEKRDFRDIEAFDENNAIIMGIAEPAIILKTSDGGKTWKKVFEDSTKGMFLDAMSFDRKGNGMVIGDPIDGKVYLAYTNDFGSSWHKDDQIFETQKGESFFASSGTNIFVSRRGKYPLFASGGFVSRLFYKNKIYPLALMKGMESAGANSIAVKGNKATIVGGNFASDKIKDSNCVLLNLKNKVAFSVPETLPSGYRSCVVYCKKRRLVTCGTSGVDISEDGGKNWKNISVQSFHVVQKAKAGKSLFLAGSKGKIARIYID
ncbi:MAG: oxidoreductase [Chitinophagaceae bacterium]|jgi:photosystem II stability/assembly factor-like uncharacterized protein